MKEKYKTPFSGFGARDELGAESPGQQSTNPTYSVRIWSRA